LAYISTFLNASDSLSDTDDYSAGGVFRHFGSWELLGRGTETTGTLRYLVEYRNRYTDDAPSPFSIDNLGNVGAIEIPFANDKWHLTNLYWAQSWNNGNFEVYVGYLDVTDFVDVFALTSPWTDFFNFAFSIGAGTMDLPDDGALGLSAGAWLTDSIYLIGGFEDLNSDPNDPGKGFDTFFSDREFFKHIEIGWARSKEQYYLDNVHLTMWHADEREETEVDDGWGAMLSLSHSVGKRWLLFARAGYADGGGSLLQKSVSIGAGYTPGGIESLGSGSQLGFGANWGQPNDEVFGSGLDDQYAIEAYYRLQVTEELSITPDVQLLINPALNPERDTIWVFGLRARVAL
jgi:porin